MIHKSYQKVSIILIVILLISNTVISVNIHDYAPDYSSNKSQKNIPDLLQPKNLKISLSEVTIPQPLPGNGPFEIDQYQTYGNCWIGTNSNVLKLAQSFTPTYNYLDHIDLKIWINFSTPIIDILFTIHSSENNQPSNLITGGSASSYQSNDFYYSTSTPNPNDHITCPWTTINFPNKPTLIPGELYWLQIEITTILPQQNHVWIGGAFNTTDIYTNGSFSYYSQGWYNIPTIDLMFITYGFNQESLPPTAHIAGPYYGYENGGETITFDASHSHDNDQNGNSIISYQWQFTNHGTWYTTNIPHTQHTYTNPGFYTITLKVTDNEGDTAATMTSVTIYPSGPPHVTTITTFYADGSNASYNKGFLLQGLDLTNIYTIKVTGKNTDMVEFTFDNTVYYDTTGNDGWTLDINTNTIVNPYTTLKIRAHNHNGWGPYYIHTPRIIPLVGWLYNYLTYLMNYTNTSMIELEIGIRDTPALMQNNYWTITASINLSLGSPINPNEPPVTAGVDVPVDDIGGTYEFSGGIGSSLSIISDGTIDISGIFLASITASSVSGTITASLHGLLTIDNHIHWQYMYLTINGEVTIPVFYIPLEICGIGIEAGIDITPHVEITFNLEPTSNPNQGILPGLGIKIQDTNGIIGNVGASVRAYAEAGLGIGEIYTEAGGEGTLYFQTPSPPGYLQDFILRCWIGGRIQLLGWTQEAWWEYQWQYQTRQLNQKIYNSTPWQPLNREYLNPQHGTYYQFHNTTSNTSTILSNIYPFSNPQIKAFPQNAGTKHMLLWTYDNPTLPPIEGLGLHYSIWEQQQGLTPPQSLSNTENDSQLQLQPQLAFDLQQTPICVFVQTPPTITTTSPLPHILSHTELAYSIYNQTTQSWSIPTYITTNTFSDLYPTLSTNQDNDIILIWIQDYDNNITTINDRSLYFSQWTTTTWTPPQPILKNYSIISQPTIAHHITSQKNWNAYCAFTLDEDHDITTANDQNIFILTIHNHPTNTTLIRLTNDTNHQHTQPSIVYDLNSTPYCIWLSPRKNTTTDPPTLENILYYQPLTNQRSTPTIITTGNIISPRVLQKPSTNSDKTIKFLIGWIQPDSTPTLHCAIIHQNQTIQHGVIYGSTNHLSQTTWDFAPAGITALTIERPPLKSTDKHNNLTIIHTQGFDTQPPQTTHTITGTHLINGPYGPIYHKNLTIHLNAQEIGLAGLKNTLYNLDHTGWKPYNNTPLEINTPKAHILQYYSTDRAGNHESNHILQFVITETQPPTKPLQPCGPTRIQQNIEHIYYTTSQDPDNDELYYKWNWGNDISPWYGPYYSGEFCVVTHKWPTKGTYPLQVITKDTYGKQSPWSDPLEITIPTTQVQIQTLLQKPYKHTNMYTITHLREEIR